MRIGDGVDAITTVKHIAVVAAAAGQAVVAQAAAQCVCCRVASNVIGLFIACTVDDIDPNQRKVLDVCRQCRIHSRTHGVCALASQLRHRIARVVDHISVVSCAANERIGT